MIPEHFYITDLGMTAYTGLWVPLVVGLSVLLGIKIKRSWPVIVPLALVLLSLPFWDVYSIGRDADRLCATEAGLHVYKTVEIGGIASRAAEYWLNYGFKYVEHAGIGPDKYYRKYRDTLENGKLVSEEISEFTVLFDTRTGDNHKVVTRGISRSSQQVFNRITNDVLGELVTLNIHPGRFDGVLLKLTGSGPVVWHCGNLSVTGEKMNYRDLVKATLKPKRREGDSQ